MSNASEIKAARRFARKTWKLEVYVENGKCMRIPIKLRYLITETLAITWRAGYEAGMRAERLKS